MITAGIDAGAYSTKAVILRDHVILAKSIIDGGTDSVNCTSEKSLHQACQTANIPIARIECVAVTGMAKRYVSFARNQVSEGICLAAGVHYVLPGTRVILDVGAQKSLAVKCENGLPLRIRQSDKCASGSGRFLDMVAETLDVAVVNLGELALQAENYAEVQSTCTVFAESEIITLIHNKRKPAEIARGAYVALAQRLYGLVLQVGSEENLCFVGGVANDPCLVKELESLVKRKISVPADPNTVSAIGAALTVQKETRL